MIQQLLFEKVQMRGPGFRDRVGEHSRLTVQLTQKVAYMNKKIVPS